MLQRYLPLTFLLILFVNPIIAGSQTQTWSDTLSDGDTFEWIVTGENRQSDQIFKDDQNLRNGSKINIEITQSLSQIELQDFTYHKLPMCDYNTSSTLSTFFTMTIDGEIMNNSYIEMRICMFIFPMIHKTDGDNLLQSNPDISTSNNLYIYHSEVLHPDFYQNTTIHWEKDTGVMQYYYHTSSQFGGLIQQFEFELLQNNTGKLNIMIIIPVATLVLILQLTRHKYKK